MKSVRDFVLWAVIDSNCLRIRDVHEKLSKYGFEKEEIDEEILSLYEDNMIYLFRNGIIGINK